MKFLFLKKCKAPIMVYLIFLFIKIRNIFLKKKIKNEKRKHQNFLENKLITNDFFSSNAFNFLTVLKSLNDNFNYLEIGSYEGNSAMFIANKFPNANINCVDSWIKTEEYDENLNFLEIEKNFDSNTSQYKNIKKYKNDSDSFFAQNNNFFQIIYVDGYHYGPQVYKDIKNSWKFLNFGGYLICDDYIWNTSENPKLTPCFVINKFLKEIKNCYKIVLISNNQIFLKKTKESYSI